MYVCMYVYSNDDGYRSSDNDYNDDDDNNNNICNSSSSSSSSSYSNASPASDASKYEFSEDRFGKKVTEQENNNNIGGSLFTNKNDWRSVNELDDNIDDIFAKLELDVNDASMMGNDVESTIISIELLIKYIDEFSYRLKKLPTEDNRFHESRNNIHTYHMYVFCRHRHHYYL